MNSAFKTLITAMHHCQACENLLDHKPRPVFQISPKATILIAGQAPGQAVHKTGVPFDDPSGTRLRSWMGLSQEIFYDADKIAILPMGLCYPGKGRSGDLPPRQECAPLWRQRALDTMPNIQLTVLIGNYALDWHLGDSKKSNLTKTVSAWQSYAPNIIPLPHPSPRNNIWLKKNPWFEADILPALKMRIKEILE